MPYAEHLPASCPPVTASDSYFNEALRFVDSNDLASLDAEEFKSHSAMGKPCPPKVSNCVWASCSLFLGESTEAFKTAIKMPKFKKKKIAVLKIPMGSGLSIVNKKGHIDFWAYSNCCLKSLTTAVRSQ